MPLLAAVETKDASADDAINASAPTSSSTALPVNGDAYYTVRDNDTMWLIATMFYDAPSANPAIYSVNRAAFEAIYDKFARGNGAFDQARHPKGPSTIFSGVTIRLPAHLSWDGVRYLRRSVPMNRDLAAKVASPEGINLTQLKNVTRGMVPSSIPVPTSKEPLSGYVSVTASSPVTLREATPAWFTTPKDPLHHCAKSVCGLYRQFCYFECLVVAKRFLDGGVSCRDLSGPLPFDIDERERDCSQIIQ